MESVILLGMSNAERVHATNLELWGIYELQRSATLNMLYYGARAEKFSSWDKWLAVAAAVGSLGTVGGFLNFGGSTWGKFISGFLGAISAIAAALPPVLGFPEKIKSLERLHFSYCELFQIAKNLALDVRRTGLLTQEQLGGAKVLHDLYSRLGQMDEAEKSKLKAKCEAEVRNRFPEGSLWYATDDGTGQETVTATTPATTEAK
jgi:hypothetical protein